MSDAPSLPLTFLGAPGSPYTRKMRALLRYRHIPGRMILQGSPQHRERPKPRIELLPTFYLPDENGQEVPVTDSTPLLRRFEKEFEGRSVIPPDPVVAFLDEWLEDYGDEWLTKAMFHFRWAFEADVKKASSILPLWSRVDVSDDDVAPLSKYFSERQIERLSYVGSNETTAPVIEASYRRFLKLFDAHLQTSPFVLGRRPASSDFALYGQLTQLALFDPTPMRICIDTAPRVYAWVEVMEDLSGLEPTDADWISHDEISPTLRALLAEAGRVYVPCLLANAAAVEAGQAQVETTIDGARWTQNPFPYQAKCLRWLRASRDSLEAADRAAVDSILDGTGAEALFEG